MVIPSCLAGNLIQPRLPDPESSVHIDDSNWARAFSHSGANIQNPAFDKGERKRLVFEQSKEKLVLTLDLRNL